MSVALGISQKVESSFEGCDATTDFCDFAMWNKRDNSFVSVNGKNRHISEWHRETHVLNVTSRDANKSVFSSVKSDMKKQWHIIFTSRVITRQTKKVNEIRVMIERGASSTQKALGYVVSKSKGEDYKRLAFFCEYVRESRKGSAIYGIVRTFALSRAWQ